MNNTLVSRSFPLKRSYLQITLLIGAGLVSVFAAKAEISQTLGNNNLVDSTDSVAAGNGIEIPDINASGDEQGVFVLGNNVVADVDNAVYLGNNSRATAGDEVGTPVLDSEGNPGDTTTAGDTGTVNSVNVGGVNFGQFAGAEANGVVTIGAAGDERRLQNVAAGEISSTATDAVNGSQLYATNEVVAANSDRISSNSQQINRIRGDFTTINNRINNNTNAIKKGMNFTGDNGETVNYQLGETVDIAGGNNLYTIASDEGISINLNDDIYLNSVTTGSTTLNNDGIVILRENRPAVSVTNEGLNNGGNRITNVAPGVNGTDAVNVNQLRGFEDEAHAGSASAIAAANLPQPLQPGKSMVSVAAGTYEGESALAIGASTTSDNGKWVLKASVSIDTQQNTGAGVGVGYQW